MAGIDPAVGPDVRMIGVSDSGGAFTVVAPLPPTLNQSYHSYPVGGHCRMVLSKAARAWKDEIAYRVRCFCDAADLYPPPRAAYNMLVTQFLTKNTRDADSSVKLVMDSIFNGMDVNDNRVFGIVIDKIVGKDQTPRVVVMVTWHV